MDQAAEKPGSTIVHTHYCNGIEIFRIKNPLDLQHFFRERSRKDLPKPAVYILDPRLNMGQPGQDLTISTRTTEPNFPGLPSASTRGSRASLVPTATSTR